MVEELCCGPCLAMEIRAPDAPVTFREFVGPADPVSVNIYLNLFPGVDFIKILHF